MLAKMYIDDSKDGLQKVAIVSAGLFGAKEQWDSLWGSWSNRLRKDGLAYFKYSHCKNLHGEFEKFRTMGSSLSAGKSAAMLVKDDLKAIIVQSGVVGIGVAIAMPDWNELRGLPGSRGFFARDPYETAMQTVMNESVKRVRRNHSVVLFVHDEGNDFNRLHDTFKSFKAKNPKLTNNIAGFLPEDDKVTPPLQAADLIAYEARELASEWVNTRELPELKKLRACIPTVSVWDKERLLDFYHHHKKKFF